MFVFLTSSITRRLFKGWNEKVQVEFLVYFVFSFFEHKNSHLSVAYRPIQYYNIKNTLKFTLKKEKNNRFN